MTTPLESLGDLTPAQQLILDEINRLGAENSALEREIAGRGAQLNPASFTHIMLQSLIEVLLPEGDPEATTKRLQILLKTNQALNQGFQQARSQVIQASLAQGSQLSPQQLQELAKQQNVKLVPGRR